MHDAENFFKHMLKSLLFLSNFRNQKLRRKNSINENRNSSVKADKSSSLSVNVNVIRTGLASKSKPIFEHKSPYTASTGTVNSNPFKNELEKKSISSERKMTKQYTTKENSKSKFK